MLGLLAAYRTLEFRLDAALEALVAVQTVRSRVRIAAALARVRAAHDRLGAGLVGPIDRHAELQFARR